MSAIRVGSYVTHSLRPAWGVGKVFGQSPQHILVGFRDLPQAERFKRMQWREGLLERADVKDDSELDSWKVECDSTCHHIATETRPRRTAKAGIWTHEDGMERFLRKYANGFVDAWYRSSYRDARLAQHHRWNELLPPGRLRELAADQPHIAAQHILNIVEMREKPLLHPKLELPRLRAALMRTEKMTTFAIALADVLDADRPSAAQYEAYLAAFGALESPPRTTPLPWPVVTALPFIAQPDKHMFVKPTPTRAAAAGLGFDLKFKSMPNWTTYDRVLAFSVDLHAFIKPRSGQDMIDVQAFMMAVVE
ncbi:MAG TPA: hypothetical protein VEA16_14165 [Vicinamibacterales bacterium]|nr:hypothetical protein [Vicinamibacterales bacterium]